MEDSDDKDDFSLSIPPLPSPYSFSFHGALTPFLGLGLALGGLTILSVRRPPKPLSVAIKLANSALSTTRAVQFLHRLSPPETLILASKTLVKTYKVTKRLNLIQLNGPFNNNHLSLASVVNTLKPCLAGVGLLRCLHLSSSTFENGFLGFGVVNFGYKVSKNFVKVVKGFGGVELDEAVRNGLESLGLVVKAVKVAKGIEQITDYIESRSYCRCRRSGNDQLRYALSLDFLDSRIDEASLDDDDKMHVGFLSFPFWNENAVDVVDGDLSVGVSVSELLCMSIPVEDCYA